MDIEEIQTYMMLVDREKRLRADFNNEDTMKLLCCKKCSDIVSLDVGKERFCKCGRSSGMYTDEINAVFDGEHCIPLGISNSDFVKAIRMAEVENKYQQEPTTCKGVDFSAFVILDCATTITKNRSSTGNKN